MSVPVSSVGAKRVTFSEKKNPSRDAFQTPNCDISTFFCDIFRKSNLPPSPFQVRGKSSVFEQLSRRCVDPAQIFHFFRACGAVYVKMVFQNRKGPPLRFFGGAYVAPKRVTNLEKKNPSRDTFRLWHQHY